MFLTIFLAVLAALVCHQVIAWLFFLAWWHDWSFTTPDEPKPQATYKPECYQCEKPVDYLFDDGRCKDCTRLTPEEVRGEPQC